MTVAIIDGDVLAHLACQPRWHDKVKYNVEGNPIMLLDTDGKKVDFEFTTEEDAKYMEKSWDNFTKKVDKMVEELYCNEYLMAMGKRSDNFRLDIYDDYKDNRHADKIKKNKFVPGIRQLAIYEEYAVWATYREADDLVRIWAEECRKYGIDYIVCSIDKDLKMIPGKYYNIKQRKLETISELSAMRNYYQQLLEGDSTDHIPGLPGVGPVKAKQMLADCENEAEFQIVVSEVYQAVYDDEWKDYLLSNGKLIHIQRHPDDYFNLEEWAI